MLGTQTEYSWIFDPPCSHERRQYGRRGILSKKTIVCTDEINLAKIHLAAMSGDNTQVSRDSVSTFHFNQISSHHLLSIDAHLLAITYNQGLL